MTDFRNKLNASLGLEDEAPNVQVNIDTDESGMPLDNITDEGENTPEADEVEIIEGSADIEADNEVIEEMGEAADSLESIYIAMESAQADGGMTPEAAVFASIAVEGIVAKYGATSKDIGISLEAFGDNRSVATTVSMEGIKDTLKALWAAIVKKFHALIKKIVDFYQTTVAAAPTLRRRAEAVRKKARETSGNPKEATFKDASLFRALHIDGKMATAAQISNGIKLTSGRFNENASKDTVQAIVNGTFIYASIATPEAALGGANHLVKQLSDKSSVVADGSGFNVVSPAVSGVPTGFRPTGNNDFTTFDMFKDLPGNKMYWEGHVTPPTPRTNPLAAVRDVGFGIYTQNPTYKADSKKEAEVAIKVLGTGEVEGLCDTIIAAMDIVIKNKTQAAKKLNDAKLIEKAGDKLIAGIKDEDAGAAGLRERATALLNSTVEGIRKLDTTTAQFMRYNFTTSKATLSYCTRSLKQYGKGV